MTKTKAYGYARKSPDDKDDTKTSIDNQVKLIKSYCKGNDLDLLKIYIDKNISGGDRFRKDFVSMIQDAITNKVPILITKDQDRFARDHSFFSDTLANLDVHGIRVFSIIKNNFLSHEDLGDIVTSVVDAHYIITQRKKARILQDQKEEEGLPTIRPPFGYKYNKKKEWVIDEKKAKIVRQIHNDLKDKTSYKDTVKRLKIDRNTYYRIIKSINKGLYSGFIIYIKKFRDANKIVVRTEEVKYKGRHEPIIENGI